MAITDILYQIDPNTMILVIFFVIVFAMLMWILGRTGLGKNNAIKTVISLAISLLAMYGLNRTSLDLTSWIYGIGISENLLYIIAPILLLLFVFFLSRKKNPETGRKKFSFGRFLMILGGAMVALGFMPFVYRKAFMIGVGAGLVALGGFIALKKKKNLSSGSRRGYNSKEYRKEQKKRLKDQQKIAQKQNKQRKRRYEKELLRRKKLQSEENFRRKEEQIRSQRQREQKQQQEEMLQMQKREAQRRKQLIRQQRRHEQTTQKQNEKIQRKRDERTRKELEMQRRKEEKRARKLGRWRKAGYNIGYNATKAGYAVADTAKKGINYIQEQKKARKKAQRMEKLKQKDFENLRMIYNETYQKARKHELNIAKGIPGAKKEYLRLQKKLQNIVNKMNKLK